MCALLPSCNGFFRSISGAAPADDLVPELQASRLIHRLSHVHRQNQILLTETTKEVSTPLVHEGKKPFIKICGLQEIAVVNLKYFALSIEFNTITFLRYIVL